MPNEKHKHPTEGIQQYPGREETIMKNNPFTRFLSVALTAVMLVGVMPGAVLADAGEAIVGASSAVVESIPESTTPADAAPVATEVPPVTEPEATPEAAQPEASPEVEATPEATEQPETTPEATEEPEATPEATEQPETTPEVTQEPEATPEATEQPEATPEATQEPEATPEATEEPETVDAQALLDELMALDDQAFLAAVDALTEEQAAALEALGEEALANLFARLEALTAEPEEAPVDYNAMSVEELYAYLRSLTDDAEYFQVLGSLSSDMYAALMEYTQKVTAGEVVVYDPASSIVPSLEAAPLLKTVQKSSSPMRMARTMSLFNTGDDTFNSKVETAEGLVLNKEIQSYSNGTGTLKLEAYVTGQVTTQTTSTPLDIVLVLDESGSMNEGFSGSVQYQVQLLQNAQADSYQETLYAYYDGQYYPVTIDATDGQTVYQQVTGQFKDLNENTTYYAPDGNGGYRLLRLEITHHEDTILILPISWDQYELYYQDNGQSYTGTGPAYEDSDKEIPNDKPVFEQVVSYTYSYSITVDGAVVDLGSSVGANGTPPVTLYSQRSYSSSRKIEALRIAASNFIDSVALDAKENEVNHRIAVVGYSSSARLYVGESTSNDTTKAFQDVTTPQGLANLRASIVGLKTNGATYIHDGIIKANDVFEANPISQQENRQRVVIMFTDGEPGPSGYESDYANAAIAAAYTSKNTHKATVYSVGIFSGANANIKHVENQWVSGDGWYTGPYPVSFGADRDTRVNRFMHLVSSNYATAWNVNEKITNIKQDLPRKENSDNPNDAYMGYYLSAADSAQLEQAFQSISESISSSKLPLDETAVLYDKMSPYVALPEGVQESDILIHTETSSDGGKTWSVDSGETSAAAELVYENGVAVGVKVTNFDYAENYVVDDHVGKKLVVTIPFQTNTSTYGGNNIPTNAETSGIYNSDGSQCYGNFEVPAVNVPVNYEIGVQHQTIYISNEAQLDDLMKYASDFYTPDGVKNAFVDIKYILAKGGVTIATLSIPAGQSATSCSWTPAKDQTLTPDDLENCTDYTISCTVKPVDRDYAEYGAHAIQTSYGPQTAWVHVMIPKVSVTDSVIDLGNAANPNSNIIGYPGKDGDDSTNGDWVDKKGDEGIPKPIGTIPTVTVTPVYEKGATEWIADSEYKPEGDVYFSLQVTVSGDRTMTLEDGQYTLVDGEWAHNTNVPGSYDTTGCIHDKDDSRDGIAFVIHVRQTEIELTIRKKLTGEKATYGKPVFDFKIVDKNTNEVQYVHLDLNTTKHSETITVTANHVYEITELSNMNYPQVGGIVWDSTDGVEPASGNWKLTKNATAIFTNEGKKTNIPTDGSAAVNTFETDQDDNYILSFKKEDLGADSQTPAVGN